MTGGQSMAPEKPAKGRGRPRIGTKVQVTLTDDQRAFAARLGAGVEAEGVRTALDALMRRPDLVSQLLPSQGR